jgi:hypothetical protein
MSFNQTVRNSLVRAYELIRLLLSDLSDADLFIRPVPQANNIAWLLGHLILHERRWISSLNLGALYPELTPRFEEQHKDAAGLNAPEDSLTKAEYFDLLAKTHEATMACLANLSAHDLDRQAIGDLAERGQTVADAFMLVASNMGMRAGLITIVRRKLGKPVLY